MSSVDDMTTRWTSTTDDWTTTTRTTTTVTTTAVDDDDEESSNTLFIIIPCVFAAIPVIIVVVCVVRAVIRHLCQPTVAAANGANLQSETDTVEMNKTISGSGNYLHPTSMQYEKLN